MLTLRRAASLFLTCALLCASFAARGETFPYTFTDSTGQAVTLPARPQTVAVLFSSYAEIWTLAGGQVSVTVGESVERGFADASALLVDENAGHSVINLETLVKAEPDLVIATADYACQREAVDFCRLVGIPAALMRVESFADYLETLAVFCEITGRPDLYQVNGSDVAARIDRLLSAINVDQPPRILFLRAGSSARSTKAKTANDHFACRMLEELGAVNIAEGENGLTGELSLEIILREDPDFLFITTMGDETAARDYISALLETPAWQALNCVQNDAWCFLPKDLFHFKPNARWAEAYEMLAELLYPAPKP